MNNKFTKTCNSCMYPVNGIFYTGLGATLHCQNSIFALIKDDTSYRTRTESFDSQDKLCQ